MQTLLFFRPRTRLLGGISARLAARVAASLVAGLVAGANSVVPAQAERGGERAAQTGKPGKPGGAGPTKTKKPPTKLRKKKARKGRPPRVMAVGVDVVISAPLQETVPIIGRVVGREGGVISARTAGPVASVRVHVGDRVKKNQILALLVTRRLRARVSLQEADLRLAEQELARLERLRTNKSAAFPRARYDDSQQKVAKAKANLSIAMLELSYAFIRAPYPGVITKKQTEAGAFLRQGDPVVTMINDRNLELEADVPVSRIAGLTKGRKVSFAMADGRRFAATVRAVIPEQSSLTRTVAVRFTPAWDLNTVHVSVNQNVTLRIPVGAARIAISVHKDAVITRGSTRMVFVVVKKAKGPPIALPRKVKLGDSVGSRFIVLRGLKPGDLVVIRGNERLRPGTPVRPIQKRS